MGRVRHDELVVNPRTLEEGMILVHRESHTGFVVGKRKDDDDGWWALSGGGGLSDRVILSGDWVILLGPDHSTVRVHGNKRYDDIVSAARSLVGVIRAPKLEAAIGRLDHDPRNQ